MPKPKNTVMVSNREALEAGINRAAWKLKMGAKYFFEMVDYDVSKVDFFDHRELRTVTAMLIDISSVENESDEVKEKFYISKLKEFEQEFLFSGDPEAKNRLMRKIYEEIDTDTNIDWDNAAEIDHIVCSLRVQQVLGTIPDRTPQDVLNAYPTEAGAKKLDTISLKNLISLGNMQNAIAAQHSDLGESIQVGANTDSYGYRLRHDTITTFVKASEDGTNVAMFDPNTSITLKKHFLGDEFDLVETKPDPTDPDEIVEEHYTSDEAAKHFMQYIYGMSDGTVNEHILVSGYLKGHSREELLFINGRPISEIIQEQENKHEGDSLARSKALISSGKILRDALTDGRSVVTLMRPYLVDGGKVIFNHQEIKVDLDKLNKIERQEKHNVFRRMLHAIGIRIRPKYPSNEARETNQGVTKSDPRYQTALKTAEKKFIDAYNKNSRDKREEEKEKMNDPTRKKPVAKDPLFNNYPEISPVKPDYNPDIINESNHNEPMRENLPPITEALEEDVERDFSQIIDEHELDKSKEFEPNVK